LKKLRIAVTSGYSSSKHAIALLHEINNIPDAEVVLLLQVKTFTLQRLKQLIRMYGWNDAWEKFKNVFIGNSNNRFVEEVAPINDFLKNRKIDFKSTSELCKKKSITIKWVRSLNEEESISAIKANRVDLIIYSGGGILRKSLIESTRYGVLNAHSGPLPYFRGMNCLEWALFYSVKPEITVHLIDAGIDTGPILKRFPLELIPGSNLYSLRGMSVVTEVVSIVEVLSNFQHYYNLRISQKLDSGIQFFIMHSLLKSSINSKLIKGWIPEFGYEEFITLKIRA
jgi:methionyl-tRNA formyltransferase